METATDTIPAEVDVAIVGSGFSGLCMAIKLREAGVDDFVVLERGDAVGGTWWFNTYPGCACDIPSHLYSFSFAPNPDWTRTYSQAGRDRGLPAARRGGLRRRALRPLRHDGHRRRLGRGRAALARRDRPRRPQRARARVRGRRAERPQDARHRGHRPLPGPDVPLRAVGPRLRRRGQARRRDRHGRLGDPVRARDRAGRARRCTSSSARRRGSCPTPTARSRARERALYRRFPLLQRLVRGGIYSAFELRVLGFVKQPRLMKLLEAIPRKHMDRQISDPELRRKVEPGYTLGCKRILPSNKWYPALGRDNVELVTDGVARGPRALDRHGRRRGDRRRRDHLRHRLQRHRHAGRALRPRPRRPHARRALAGQPAGAPRRDRARLPEPVHAARPQHGPRAQLDGLHDRVPGRARDGRAEDDARPRRRDARGQGRRPCATSTPRSTSR